MHYVAGNCDWGSDKKDELIEADGKLIFLTHGDLYRVKMQYDTISRKAEESGADIAVFGHTHIPFCEKNGGIMLLNPGSARYTKTYGVIETEDGILRACTVDM